MRNLKRVLSLVMAVAMLIGLMVVSASAASTYDDFTDKDEIVNKEAVNTMVSLGVINGKEDGSYFDPTGVVTRAEMAKLIAVTLNGGKDPLLGTGAVTTQFSDVANNYWAAPYIAYCANLGIINGKGDGTFGPEEPVTGTAAAKMMLTALGYRADIEGLTGTGWDLNSDTLANKVGLYDGMSIVPSNGLSRDNTAQLIYNGVQAQEVEYRNNYGEYSGVIYAQPNGTILENRFNVRKVEGVVEATSLIALSGNTTVDGKTRLSQIEYNGSRYDANNKSWGDVTYPIAIDSNLLGQRVVIYVKGLNALSPNATSMEVVGTAIVSDDNAVVETSARLKDDKAVKDALKGSGIAVEGQQSELLITYKDTVRTAWDSSSDSQTNAGKNYFNGVVDMPGLSQTFIDNNADGTVDVIIQKEHTLTKVNTYNDSKETLNLSVIGTVDFVDVLNPEDVAQGDYVLVYNYDGTYVLETAKSVSGTVSAFINNADAKRLSKITVDGTNYGWAVSSNLAPDLQDKDDVAANLNAAGSALEDLVDGTYTLYLDPNGNMLGFVEDEGAIGNYAVITGVNAVSSNNGFLDVEVKMILADGTTGKYDVNLLASANKYGYENLSSNNQKEAAMFELLTGIDKSTNVTATGDMKDTLVSYSLDGSTVTLSNPNVSTASYKTDSTGAELKFKSSTSGYVFANGTVMADDRTVFFIKDKNDNYTAVSGLSKLPADSLTVDTAKGINSQVIFYQPAGNATKSARAIFAVVKDEFVSSSNYAFVTGSFTRTTEGTDTIYTYPVVLSNGEVTTLKTKNQITVAPVKDGVHEYQVNGNYVNFDGNIGDVVNAKVIIGVGNNAVTVADVDNIHSASNSYATTGATIWNVEDTENVFETTLQLNDKVALVLDYEGNVEYAFVYDRLDDDMVGAPTGGSIAPASALTDKDNGAINDTSFLTAGGIAYWNNATGSMTFKPALPAATMGGTVSAEYTIDGSAANAYVPATGIVINAAADGSDVKTPHEIKLTISEKDANGKKLLTDCVITYKVIVSNPTVTAPSVSLDDVAGKGSLDFTGALTAGETKNVAVSNFETGKQIKFTVGNGTSDGTVKSIALDGQAYVSGTPVTVDAAGNTFVLTVVMQKAGSADTTYTYTVSVTAASQAQSTPGTVKLEDDSNITLTDETLTADGTNTVNATAYVSGTSTIKFTDTASANSTATLKIGDGVAQAYTWSTPITLDQATGEEVTFVLTVTTTETGKAPVEHTYTAKLTAKADAPAPTFTLNAVTGTGRFDASNADKVVTAGSTATATTDCVNGDTINFTVAAADGFTVVVTEDGAGDVTDNGDGTYSYGVVTGDLSGNVTITVTLSHADYATTAFTYVLDVAA